jgi:hypothetical protein
MNKIEAMNRVKTLIGEAQKNAECVGSAEILNQGMRAWVGDILVAELGRAMKGLTLFRKAADENSEETDGETCRKLATRLRRRATELSASKLGDDASDEAVCVFYFFPQVIGTLGRIARVFDPAVETADDANCAEAS